MRYYIMTEVKKREKEHNCEPCEYSTDSKKDYRKHMATDKHYRILKEFEQRLLDQKQSDKSQQDSSKTCSCQLCHEEILKKDILVHLATTCPVLLVQRQLDDQKCENKLLKNQLESEKKMREVQVEAKDVIVEAKDEIVEILKEENKNKNKVLNTVSTTASNATSALKYITTHYANAPPLQPIPLKDYSKILDEEKISDIMVQQFEDDTLHEYLGNMLIKLFRKNDPLIQALWNSDAARQTFLIKTLKEWTVDKKGIKFTETVVNPFLIHIQNILLAHKNKVYDSTLEYISKVDKLQQEVYKWDRSMKVAKERGPRPNYDDKIKKLNTDRQKLDMSVILYANLIMQIGMDKITGPILKYISPYFSIDKNGNTNDQKKLKFNDATDEEDSEDQDTEKEKDTEKEETHEEVDEKQEVKEIVEVDDDGNDTNNDDDDDDYDASWAAAAKKWKHIAKEKEEKKSKKSKKTKKIKKNKKKKTMVV
jgi:hypothetical protein